MAVHRVSVFFAAMAAALILLGSLGWQAGAQAAQGGQNEGGEPGDATLRIGGDRGTRFAGTCTVGREEHLIGGRAPQSFEYDLDGRKLACEIGKDRAAQSNGLEVVLRGEHTRSVQRVVGGDESVIEFTYDDGNISSSISSSSSQVASRTAVGGSDSSTADDGGREGGGDRGSLADRIRKRVDGMIEQAVP